MASPHLSVDGAIKKPHPGASSGIPSRSNVSYTDIFNNEKIKLGRSTPAEIHRKNERVATENIVTAM